MEAPSPLPLPPEIRVEQLSPGDVRYVLPRRPLGKYRWFAVVPLVFAFIAMTFLWGWFAAIAGWPAQMPDLVGMLFVAIGLVSAVPMVLLPIALSVAMVWGHSEIEIRGGQLWCGEYVGILRWRRRRQLADIQRLVVCSSAGEGLDIPHDQRTAGETCCHSRGNGPWQTAVGSNQLPAQWLVPLAHELARHVQAAQPELSTATAASDPHAEVVELRKIVEVEHDRLPGVRFEQPVGSLIVMTEQAGSLTFEVPPAGIKRGSAGLFFFACLWLAFMAVFTTMAVVALVQGNQPQQPQPNELPSWTLIPFILFFWLIGAGLMLGALRMAQARGHCRGRRPLSGGTGRLVRRKEAGLGSRRIDERAGRSQRHGGQRQAGDGAAIHSVAGQEIRRAVGPRPAGTRMARDAIDASARLGTAAHGAAMLADVDVKPANSDATYEELPGTLTISIPRSRLRRGPLAFWIFAAFWNGLNVAVATPFVLAARKDAIGESLFPFAMMSLFGLIGLVLIGVAMHMTIRRAEIAFAASRLLVLQFGLLGKRRHEWAVEELAAIRGAASGTSVGNQPMMQLQIVPINGKTVSLLTGRDDQELAWIATVLRRALKLPAETEARAQPHSN